ncbi:MAG: hypothetical protein J6A15_09400 [Clostridia bacterium]|nr:hypothetical protein [Clostridia bacterium]
MNDFLSKIIKNFKSTYTLIENETLSLIEKISDINTDVFLVDPLKSFYTDDNISILKVIILSIVFGIILYKVGKNSFALYNEGEITSLYYLIIKTIVVVIISLNSNYILKEIIHINYMFTEVIDSFFSQIADKEIQYTSLIKQISNIEEFLNDQYKINIKDSSKFISCFLMISILLVFSIRYVFVILFIILFPFLITLILFDKGEYYFSKLFEFFMFNLLIQSINKVIIFVPIISKKEELYEIILIGSLIVLYKLNKMIINIGDIWKK